MKKIKKTLTERFAHLETEENWRMLGIAYLTVLLPLIIIAFVIMALDA